ncbi:O-methyltransferase [Polymorphospora rubra]|uniref:O-methyltransferase n=1 Tax=Polymorphospora rubra TaxID=338584 RepID=UPI0033FBBDD5
MTKDAWDSVDRYFSDLLIPADPVLAAVLRANQEAGLPAMDVAPNQGKLLMLLARISGARRILEIGTLGAYSTIWLARGIPADGRIVTLEAEPSYAAVARANLDRAGVADRVDLRLAPALRTLPELVAQRAGPFDLVFIDADKPNNPHYLEWALRLTRPGSLIIGDNVVRDGHVVDAASADEKVRGVRTFLEMTAADPRLDATALQTVGSKGWDGFSLAVVR